MLLVLCLLASFAMQICLLANKSDQALGTDVGQTMLAFKAVNSNLLIPHQLQLHNLLILKLYLTALFRQTFTIRLPYLTWH